MNFQAIIDNITIQAISKLEASPFSQRTNEDNRLPEETPPKPPADRETPASKTLPTRLAMV